MSDSKTAEFKRVFLALWPDEVTRQQLFEAQKQLKFEAALQTARAVMPANLHMTLYFLGLISTDALPALETCLDELHCQPFDMTVSTVGCFPKHRVFWLGLKNIPPELTELEQQTAACVQQCLEDYSQIPYRPHITLFRKAKTTLEWDNLAEIHWPVKSFALVESKTWPDGVRYKVLKEWPLLR